MSRGWKYLDLTDILIAVRTMHVICRPDDDVQARAVAVWPSMEDLRDQLTLFWSDEKLESIRGTFASRFISRVRNELNSIFEHVIEPALGKASIVEEGLFHKEGSTLRDLFHHGFGISYSRSHGSSDDDVTIKPLIDVFNGLPDSNRTGINVEVHRGKWPFLRGSIFRNDCNLNVSGVASTRSLRAGEDLIIDYGPLNTSQFLLKYGVVPRPIQTNGNGALDTIEFIIPLDLRPDSTDVRRLRAVRDIFGYDGYETEMGSMEMRMSDLAVFQRGHEPRKFMSLRQLCVLLIGEDHDIKAFCDCNGSRFRFNFNSTKLVRVFKRIFDYNLELLIPCEDEHVVREIERRGFQAWRKAVLEKYDRNVD